MPEPARNDGNVLRPEVFVLKRTEERKATREVPRKEGEQDVNVDDLRDSADENAPHHQRDAPPRLEEPHDDAKDDSPCQGRTELVNEKAHDEGGHVEAPDGAL